MKLKKYLVLPVAATGSLYLTSCGDKGADKIKDTVTDAAAAVTDAVEADSFVDSSAANYKKGDFSDYSQLIKDSIDAMAGDDLPEGMTSAAIIDAIGYGNVKTYEQSSTPKGSEWVNKMKLDNGGDHQGLMKLIADSQYSDLSVADMAPAGTDLAFQIGLNLKSAEDSILSFMKTGAKDKDIEEFKAGLQEQVPMMDMTGSELMQKLDLRLNLALDMDPAEQLPTPFGSFDKPNLVIRFDGLAWVWEKVGAMAIGGTGMPFQKAEADGITTYSLPAEMAAQFMGYSPQIRVDAGKDQIWLASTPDFMAKCTSGTNTLSSSEAYKATMQDLGIEGQIFGYASKEFADFAAQMLTKLKEQGMMENADAATKLQVDNAMKQLSNVKTGVAQVVNLNKKGIYYSERGVQNIEQQMLEAKKAFEDLKKAK